MFVCYILTIYDIVIFFLHCILFYYACCMYSTALKLRYECTSLLAYSHAPAIRQRDRCIQSLSFATCENALRQAPNHQMVEYCTSVRRQQDADGVEKSYEWNQPYLSLMSWWYYANVYVYVYERRVEAWDLLCVRIYSIALCSLLTEKCLGIRAGKPRNWDDICSFPAAR